MELRAFAERILFSSSLEDKLRSPRVITDDHPGPPLLAPGTPGRPRELRFKKQGSGKVDFPGLHRLEKEQERGRLLHFFANHELLATELMALALLRFPDAPAAFRRGVLNTLKDEQEHTRLYLERMRQCGIQFGDLPVSGYFWRCVSNMENPIDYVAGLCLAFEQANLDFARQFSRGFERVGDNSTAGLLDRIYHDEIGHVAYGLKWFRRWKNPNQSDWEAFCRSLKFPLTPQRAKGFALNVEGRRAAGLDPEFIARLNVHSQSRGRTPGIFCFNPLAEGYIAGGGSFTPGKAQMLLARDLENLPQFLCHQDDVVLVGKMPAMEFLSGLKQAGFPLPEFVLTRDNSRQSARAANAPRAGSKSIVPGAFAQLTRRKVGCLRPWAWGPDSLEVLEPLFGCVSGDRRNTTQCFNEDVKRLYSKSWSADLLRSILPRLASAGGGRDRWLCTANEVGTAVRNLDEALAVIAAIRKRGQHRIVVKESIGLAGHNSIRLWEPSMLDSQRRWMANLLEQGRELVIEPWLEREVDFSVQLEMTPDGLKLRGYTGLINDRKGQFQASWAEPRFPKRPPARVFESLNLRGEAVRYFQRLYPDIVMLLAEELRRVNYLGPLGIDALVYCAPDGAPRLKPIVEINPRYTMGRLTIELMKRTTPGSFGLFQILNRGTIRKAGHEDFNSLAKTLTERHPLRFEGAPVSRIREGVVVLNDPAEAQVCLAVLEVGRELPTPGFAAL